MQLHSWWWSRWINYFHGAVNEVIPNWLENLLFTPLAHSIFLPIHPPIRLTSYIMVAISSSSLVNHLPVLSVDCISLLIFQKMNIMIHCISMFFFPPKIQYIMKFRISPTHPSTSIMMKPPLTSCQSDTNQLSPAAAHLEVERGLSPLQAL